MAEILLGDGLIATWGPSTLFFASAVFLAWSWKKDKKDK